MTKFRSGMRYHEIQDMIQYEEARSVFNKYRHHGNYDALSDQYKEQDGQRYGKKYLTMVLEITREGLDLDINEEWNDEIRRWALEKRDKAMAQHKAPA